MPDWTPKKATTGALRVVYVLLDEAHRWDRNPKRHDISALVDSIRRHGFRDPPIYDAALGAIVAGNGRIEALTRMRDEGAEPPRGVALDGKGRWCAPILVGVDAESKRAAEAFGIDHNALTLAGSDIPPEMVASLFDPDAMRRILADMDAAPVSLARELMDAEVWVSAHVRSGTPPPEETPPQAERYTGKITAPIYEITGAKPAVSDLYKAGRSTEILARIEAADVPDEVREFLRAAAARHVVFDYHNIAEFYAHADPEIQELMEDSALVIIDFDRAIEDGYVRVSDEIQRLRGLEEEAEDAG